MTSVYSYLRFSDARQSIGDSATRQMQYAARWAAEHGMQLDEQLSMRDEGLSAYHQQHVKSGALGVFLRAIAEGRIVPGSVLIVEGLDRLSRAEPVLAQAQLSQIITAGITVVTASDGKVYTRESLRTQPMDLVYSLLIMIRAHEESATKSRRVSAALARQVEAWQAGTYRGPIRAGHDPAYLTWDAQAGGWSVDPSRAAAVLRMIELYRLGLGSTQIIRRLLDEGLSPTGGVMPPSHIYRMMRSRALYGDRELMLDGQTHLLSGYYPALMTRAEWDALQLLAEERSGVSRRVRGELPHMLTGSGIARCGYCGSTLAGQHMYKRRKPGELLADGYRRLLCAGKTMQVQCPRPGSCSVAPVERAIMRYCSDQIQLDDLLRGPDHSSADRAMLATLRASSADRQRQIDRLAAALAQDDGAAPLAVLRQIRALEAQQQQDQAEAHRLERTLAVSSAGTLTHDQAAEWAALAEAAVERHDFDARVRAREMIAATFARIVVYHHGEIEPDTGVIDILLRTRSGVSRRITIDRRTGERRAQDDRKRPPTAPAE